MRCKLHPYANAAGVCAPCLRDRLLTLAAERSNDADCGSSSSCGTSPLRPAAVHRLFPRSVSPYAAHRRSDACAYGSSSSATCSYDHHHQQPSLLFFRTPQVGPTAAAARADEHVEESKKAARRSRRSFLSAIFGGGGGRHARADSKKDPPRRSTSWLSAIVRRKRRPETAPAASLPPPLDEEPESPSGSRWWFPSPSPARQHRRSRPRPGGSGASGDGISGLAVCLSPLVRPSSGGGRRRCQPPEPSSLGVGESHRRHLSAGGAASFGRNTSRKLAGMGRLR